MFIQKTLRKFPNDCHSIQFYSQSRQLKYRSKNMEHVNDIHIKLSSVKRTERVKITVLHKDRNI
jgi:hypothetical protein